MYANNPDPTFMYYTLQLDNYYKSTLSKVLSFQTFKILGILIFLHFLSQIYMFLACWLMNILAEYV